jgi:uncharacterized protein DUF6496
MPPRKSSSRGKSASSSGSRGKGKRKIAKVMREHKQGALHSGSGKKVTSRKQAVAIALNEARESGARIPKKKSSKKP